MSDSKQFRSEESRKNYEKAERRRIRAQQRKARKAKASGLCSAAGAWLKQNPRKAVTAAVLVIVIAVLAAVVIRAVADPLKGRRDNWLIIDVNAGDSADYRHLADFDVPEGYALDDYSTYSDETTQDFFCKAQDESAVVQDVYISGSTALPAADFPSTVLSYNLHKTAGEPRQVTVAGKDGYALYMVTDESEYYCEGMNLAHLSIYFDAEKDACITAILRSDMLPFDQLPDEAAMLAEAERLLQNLTLVK